MQNFCDLQVDVNGQHIFWISKELLTQFSSTLSNLFEKRCKNGGGEMKIIYKDFPGGAAGFELITRFIYNNNTMSDTDFVRDTRLMTQTKTNGTIDITFSNVVLLNHIANYMGMNKNVFGRPNLIDQTKKFLEGIQTWSWFELLEALKHAQCLSLDIDIDTISSIRRLVYEVVERLISRCVTTPSISSANSSFRSSVDSKITLSTTKSGYLRIFWWFEDLSRLNIEVIDIFVRKMVLEKFDHTIISKFLFYYQRERVIGESNKVLKVKVIEKIIILFSLLDKRSISIKGLFETLRISANLEVKKAYKSQLEVLIGVQLDQVTLDDLILPRMSRTNKKSTMYDVNLVLRLLKNFLLEGNYGHKLYSYRLKRVARLVDLYANEIAPDFRLKYSKFVALGMAIPDSARDSCDKIYEAIEIFLEAHPKLTEEQKMKTCGMLNYKKLSTRVLNGLCRNTIFPLYAIVEALIHQNPTLKSSNHKVLTSCNKARPDQVVVKEFAKNSKFRLHLQEMGWTDLDLQDIFGKLKNDYVTNVIMTPKPCCAYNVKHLPKLCS